MSQPHVTFKLRHDISVQWASKNILLQAGEPGYESDNRRLKIGDGITRWNDLEYALGGSIFGDADSAAAALQEHINSATPHPIYDDGPSLLLLYQNAKV